MRYIIVALAFAFYIDHVMGQGRTYPDNKVVITDEDRRRADDLEAHRLANSPSPEAQRQWQLYQEQRRKESAEERKRAAIQYEKQSHRNLCEHYKILGNIDQASKEGCFKSKPKRR